MDWIPWWLLVLINDKKYNLSNSEWVQTPLSLYFIQTWVQIQLACQLEMVVVWLSSRQINISEWGGFWGDKMIVQTRKGRFQIQNFVKMPNILRIFSGRRGSREANPRSAIMSKKGYTTALIPRRNTWGYQRRGVSYAHCNALHTNYLSMFTLRLYICQNVTLDRYWLYFHPQGPITLFHYLEFPLIPNKDQTTPHGKQIPPHCYMPHILSSCSLYYLPRSSTWNTTPP